MMTANEECVICGIVDGRTPVTGGVLWSDDRFAVYGFPDACPVAGYVLVATRRHVRGLYDLDDADAGALGALVARVQRAQRAALGADHAYAFVLGDRVPHVHVHVVPRYADSPAHLRGGRLFSATAADARPTSELEPALRRLRDALAPG